MCVSYGTKSPGVCRRCRVWMSSDFLRLPPESVPFPFTELLVAKALVRFLICIHLTLTSSASLCWWFHADAALTCSWRYVTLCTLCSMEQGSPFTILQTKGIRSSVSPLKLEKQPDYNLAYDGNPQEVWVAIPAVVKLTVFTLLCCK